MKKAVRWITGIAILLAAVLLVVLKLVDESNKVEFADEYLGKLIMADGLSNKSKEGNLKGLEYKDFRKDDLKYVTSVDIVLLRHYETLVDLEKCPNLEFLKIRDGYGDDIVKWGDWVEQYYERNNLNPPPSLSAEKIRQFETELECVNLKVLTLYDCDISELGQISRLEKLQILDLDYTQIEEAGDIVNLEYLERLYITGTPLAENEEELQRLREAIPNLEIITNGSY